jgi:N6-adenosine-specific RNA methylase IME4
MPIDLNHGSDAEYGGSRMQMRREDAEEFTQSLGQIVGGSYRQIALAERLGIPKALGLSTDEWVRQRLGGYMRLSISERRDAVLELAAEGMSQRQIGRVLGVSEATVNRDMQPPVTNVTPLTDVAAANAFNNHPTVTNVTLPEIDTAAIIAEARREADAEIQALRRKIQQLEQNAQDEPDDSDRIEAELTPLRHRVAASEAALAQSEKRESVLREQLKVAQTPVVVPVAQYGTVVIDPPWPMQKIGREVRPNQVEFDYPTMDYEQLCPWGRQHVVPIMADDCHFFMWTTHKFLPMALRLFDDYGVRYVLTMVWHKPGGFQPIGLPQYNCEFAIYGRKGSPKFTDTKAFNCAFTAARREHSRKPDEFYDLVRRVTAEGRVDVFSREKREGFDQAGNEVEKFEGAA